jgi:hypothetical protein
VVNNRLLASGHAVNGRRGTAIIPEQLIALKSHPCGEHQQRYGAHADRHVHQEQTTSDHSRDKNPDCDNDYRGAEPDHPSTPRARARPKS